MTSLPLREYQRDAIEAVRKDWSEGFRRTAIVLPTGGGKTVVFAHTIDQELSANPNARVLVLAHRTELIEQAADKIRAVAPHLTIGIVKAARREYGRQVIVASVQSLRSETQLSRLRGVTLVIVDECHHATAPTYQNILRTLGCFDDNGARALGVTATLTRSDDQSLGDVWQKVSYTKPILGMISHGFLVKPRGIRVKVEDLDLNKVKQSRGDLQDSALGEALEESLAPEAAAKAYQEHATGRRGVMFTPTVSSAYAFADAFNDIGIKTETVDGKTPDGERRAILDRLRSGATDVVSNCMVLTEGFDCPELSCAVIARPTQSAGLYIQMVGRVLRTFPGKKDALILDVVGATGRHKIATLIDLIGREKREFQEEETDQELLDVYPDDEELSLGNWQDADAVDEYLGANGKLISYEVDLFTNSHQAWQMTDGGAWFMPAGPDHFVFLASSRDADKWDVCWAHKTGGRGRGASGQSQDGGWTEHLALDIEYAMAWGETVAQTYDPFGTYSAKDRAWRKVKTPSEAQLKYAKALGIIVTPDMRKGDVGDAITKVLASRRIDPVIAAIMKGRGK